MLKIYIKMVNRQKKALGWVGTITQGSKMITGKKLGNAINERAVGAVNMPSYKKGGRVRKTGPARLHKGEVVLNASAVKALRKLMM
jgi:hypothetical protein